MSLALLVGSIVCAALALAARVAVRDQEWPLVLGATSLSFVVSAAILWPARRAPLVADPSTTDQPR